jgi:hypothetical protein
LAQAITSARNLADLVNDAQYRLAPALAVVEGPMMAAYSMGRRLRRGAASRVARVHDKLAGRRPATETLLPLEITRGEAAERMEEHHE